MGSLCDKFGKRVLLITSLFGSSTGAFLQSLCKTNWQFILARAYTGALGGSNTVAFAYIADCFNSDVRPKQQARLTGIISCSLLIGPTIGSLFGSITLFTPLYVIAGCAFITLLITIFILPDSKVYKRDRIRKRRLERAERRSSRVSNTGSPKHHRRVSESPKKTVETPTNQRIKSLISPSTPRTPSSPGTPSAPGTPMTPSTPMGRTGSEDNIEIIVLAMSTPNIYVNEQVKEDLKKPIQQSTKNFISLIFVFFESFFVVSSMVADDVGFPLFGDYVLGLSQVEVGIVLSTFGIACCVFEFYLFDKIRNCAKLPVLLIIGISTQFIGWILVGFIENDIVSYIGFYIMNIGSALCFCMPPILISVYFIL